MKKYLIIEVPESFDLNWITFSSVIRKSYANAKELTKVDNAISRALLTSVEGK